LAWRAQTQTTGTSKTAAATRQRAGNHRSLIDNLATPKSLAVRIDDTDRNRF
jgi:hypothetical protein